MPAPKAGALPVWRRPNGFILARGRRDSPSRRASPRFEISRPPAAKRPPRPKASLESLPLDREFFLRRAEDLLGPGAPGARAGDLRFARDAARRADALQLLRRRDLLPD